MQNRVQRAQQAFLTDQALYSAVNASLQRASVYNSTATQQQRDQLRKAMRDALEHIGHEYVKSVSEDRHLSNIESLAIWISNQCGASLLGSCLRIGIAQKALNLYLKYLWCFGRIPSPPHCPFDSVVIDKLPSEAYVAWTRLSDPKQYTALVEAAKRKAGSTPLPVWELEIYQHSG